MGSYRSSPSAVDVDSTAGVDQAAMSWMLDRRLVPVLFLLLLRWTRSVPGLHLGQGMGLCLASVAAVVAKWAPCAWVGPMEWVSQLGPCWCFFSEPYTEESRDICACVLFYTCLMLPGCVPLWCPIGHLWEIKRKPRRLRAVSLPFALHFSDFESIYDC